MSLPHGGVDEQVVAQVTPAHVKRCDSISFTAAMSIADTGHLVLSTVQTTNGSQSVSRSLDFFKAEEREQIRRQLANTLEAFICQRRVTTLADIMTPAVEILINTPTVKKLIEEGRLDKLAAAIETGTDHGMISFNQALYSLVKEGKVSGPEALSKATNPQALELSFKGIFLDEGRRLLNGIDEKWGPAQLPLGPQSTDAGPVQSRAVSPLAGARQAAITTLPKPSMARGLSKQALNQQRRVRRSAPHGREIASSSPRDPCAGPLLVVCRGGCHRFPAERS